MSESRPLPPQQSSLRPQVVVPKSPGLAPRPTVSPQPAQAPQPKPVEAAGEPLELVDETSGGAQPMSKIKTIGLTTGQHWTDKFTKRKTNTPGTGATRVRSFHGRLSEEGLVFLDDKINEWLDAHPDIEVKFITSTIGVFEGKIREPSLVLNVWY